jgi:hypothetical protein
MKRLMATTRWGEAAARKEGCSTLSATRTAARFQSATGRSSASRS